MVEGAVYDAVNAIAGGYVPYLPTPAADPLYSQDAAAATAAFRVASALVPSQLATLQTHYDASLLAIPPGPAKTGGIAVGEAAAAAMLAARANDGRNGSFTFVIGTTLAPGGRRHLLRPRPDAGSATTLFLLPNAAMLRSTAHALTRRRTPTTQRGSRSVR
jgi:hypothetical protein